MSEIRVRNATGAPLDEVRVTLAGGEPVTTGPLPEGTTSAWIAADVVHRYPAVTATGPGTDLVHLPYEGTSQPALPAGSYTYTLRVEGGRLVVDLGTDA